MIRIREHRTALAFGVSLLLTVVLDAGTATAVTEPGPVSKSEPDPSVTLDLTHPVSVRDALVEASKWAIDVQELRLSGNGVVGGLVPRSGTAPASQQAWVESAFQRRFQTVPAVTQIVLAAKTRESAARGLVTTLADAATPMFSPMGSVLQRSATATSRVNGQDLDEHFPSLWEGDTYRAHYPDGLATRAYDNWFVYESAFGAQPWSFPADWGMEIGITTYKSDDSSPRPFCPVTGADTNFWSGTYNLGGLWGTNVSASAAPYADSAIFSDSCNVNSAELGVGYPAQLFADTTYLVFVELFPGARSTSAMSASMSMQSNDCNDLGRAPATDCMGLNVVRRPPTGFDQSNLLVNRDRTWTVSGCFFMADGLDAPERILSGSQNCPWDVYY